MRRPRLDVDRLNARYRLAQLFRPSLDGIGLGRQCANRDSMLESGPCRLQRQVIRHHQAGPFHRATEGPAKQRVGILCQ